jgi:glutamine synthetase
MREKLQRRAYENLLSTLNDGKPLLSETADAIAEEVKDWAVGQGATHYCHWFQPMTGLTAEKHDAFISVQHTNHSELKVIERFTGSQLIQGEPDASSLPSGGMRSTFEARGYTAWDPTSPLFLLEDELGHKTLCIPSVFFGYHGEALDLKTPLLRSQDALSTSASQFLKLLGDLDVKNVDATIGAEQEYFLIDRQYALLRPDIVMSGRTLLGAPPARGQQMSDHYFGTIPSRVKIFMEDLEKELYRLGIPIKTRHNEVAPSQFEVAPLYENASIAADHNTLLMEVVRQVAHRHGLMALFHEKPFAGLNGTGKHCNWSLSNSKGENLLDPGKTPHQNLRFLANVAVAIKAINDHATVLRASVANPGNDHRLGANEAPPAIMSVFVGSNLSKILQSIANGEAADATEEEIINLGVSKLPKISAAQTDRNRTSPFAFTGNKFEFRAVGGSSNIATPVAILNAAAADAYDQAAARLKELLESCGSRDEAVVALIKELVTNAKSVCFEGNSYSDEWEKEAEKRGLPNLKSTPEALPILKDASATEFLVRKKVLTKDEIESRYNVAGEHYVNTLDIELVTLRKLVWTHVVPAVERQLRLTHKAFLNIQSESLRRTHQSHVCRIEDAFESILVNQEKLTQVIEELDSIVDQEAKMMHILREGIKVRDELRKAVDFVETIVSDEFWPLPKYREMLFANMM